MCPIDTIDDKVSSETCLNRLIGRCKNCKEDYDKDHHPNNLDCPSYKPIKLYIFEVK